MDRGSAEFSDGGHSDLQQIPEGQPGVPEFLPDKVATHTTPGAIHEDSSDVRTISELPPDQQDLYLYEQAIASADALADAPDRSLFAKVRASELLPAGRESAYKLHGLFNEIAATLHPGATRSRLMSGLSKRDGMQAAWDEALTYATASDSNENNHSASLLAEIVEGQTDPTRLHEAREAAKTIPDRGVRAIAEKTIVKQAAAAGRISDALSVIFTMPHRDLGAVEREEAQIRVVESLAKQGDLAGAKRYLEIGVESATMTAWGEAKLAKYDTSITERHLDLELGNVWHYLGTNRHSEIVQDLLDGRFTDLAYKYAQHISIPQSPTVIDKEAQTTAIINVARTVATTDQDKATDMLHELWENSIGAMDHMMTGETQFDAAQARQLAQHYATSADRATAEIVALTYRDRPQHVNEAIEGAGFLTDQPELAQAITCAAVARSWAEAGMIDDAVRVASIIPNDSSFGVFRSEVFTDIGRALRSYRSGNA